MLCASEAGFVIFEAVFADTWFHPDSVGAAGAANTFFQALLR